MRPPVPQSFSQRNKQRTTIHLNSLFALHFVTLKSISAPTNIHIEAKMAIDDDTLSHYLADSPPTIVPLTIKPHFEALSEKEQFYAHYISV